MTKFQLWSLKRLIKVIVWHHQLDMLMQLLRDEMKKQWYEDNEATREFYIQEAVDNTAP